MNAMSIPISEPPPTSTADEHHGEHRSAEAKNAFEADVLEGLSQKQKTLPCKYFYDTRGSELFEQICETPEYYVTRTELALLEKVCPQIAKVIGASADVLEPGSGAGEKIRILLRALEAPRTFVPIDISKTAVEASGAALREAFPEVDVIPLVADFTHPFELPPAFREKTPHKKLIFFPGSTISNFAPPEAKTFLEGLRHVLSPGDFLFIGVDRVKDHGVLEAAYDDAAGVTADFNLNLVDRINRELESDLSRDRFTHRAVYNADDSRIEMHLVSKVAHQATISGKRFSFAEGETIHTENSYKYTPEAFTSLAAAAGFEVDETFSDAKDYFSLYLCRVPG